MVGQDPTMSISAVSPIPSALVTTPVAPIRPIAPSSSQQSDASAGSAKPQAANPPGVGRLIDFKV
jgi:hypothetical protein